MKGDRHAGEKLFLALPLYVDNLGYYFITELFLMDKL